MILDGRKTAQQLKLGIAEEVANLPGEKRPHLVAVLIGEDGASQTYVKNKKIACDKVGFHSTVIKLPENTSEIAILQKIKELNQDPHINGIIVQLPLPKHLNASLITQSIGPEKDVDGFHTESLGKMILNQQTFLPATPFGIVKLIEAYDIPTRGKHAVILGRSNIVGRPLSVLLSSNNKYGNATVSLCHSKTENVTNFTKQADILIAALGIPKFVKDEMIKPGATVIDVGITRVADDTPKGYTLQGDVDFENVQNKASYITTVPGGVGPMTILGLLTNTLQAFKKQNQIH